MLPKATAFAPKVRDARSSANACTGQRNDVVRLMNQASNFQNLLVIII
jgi:hypothetical protein